NGAQVAVHTCDVTDEGAVSDWLSRIEAEQPVDLLIVNAGLFDGNGPAAQLETAEEARRVIETNLTAAIFCAQAAMRHMVPRRRGHIAFVSSLAAIVPLADAPSYSASKAGLVAYAAALRELLLEHGIRVTTILPGHV